MTEPKDIDEVLLAVQGAGLVLTKDRKGQVGNQKTKYADLAQVNEVVLAFLNGLSTTWVCRPHLEAGVFGLHYALRHVPSATEKAGIWPLKLSENPQQLGSATTYGRRYALLAVTGVVSEDEDDDGDAASSGDRYAQRAPTGAAAGQRPARTAQRGQRAAAGPPLPGEASAGRISPAQMGKMRALLAEVGYGGPEHRDEALRYASDVIGREVASSTELTVSEASAVIDRLAKWAAQDEPPTGGE